MKMAKIMKKHYHGNENHAIDNNKYHASDKDNDKDKDHASHKDLLLLQSRNSFLHLLFTEQPMSRGAVRVLS